MSRFSCAFLLLFALSTASAQTRYLISTIAGSNPLGDGGPAAQGLLWNPLDVAADANGNIYIADTDNNLIRRISGGVITTYACNGQPGHSGDGGPALQAECYNPAGIAVDSAGNLYFSDSFNNCVRRVSSDGVISNYAGNGELGYGGDGGPASFASLNQPRGLAVDKSGNLHVADSYNRRIRRVRPTGIIDTVAGTGTMGATGDGGPAVKATFMMPVAVAVDVSGNILAADGYYNGRVRRFSPGGNITTFAGGGPLTDPLTYTGFGASVTLWYPQGLAVDGKGSVYIALGNSTVVVVNSGIVGFFAGVIGTSGAYGGDDASATMAYFNNPHGLAADAAGNLYIADSANHRIRLVATNAIVTTLAGYGHFAGDFGPATSAVLSSPSFLAL